MTRPGNTFTREDDRSPAGPNLALATPFVVCETERASTAVQRLRSMRDYTRLCGARTVDTAAGYDWLDEHFRQGGAAVYVATLRGPAAAKARVNLAASSGVSMLVEFPVEGVYGNRHAIDVDVSAGTFVLTVFRDGVLVKTSPALANATVAQAWAASIAGGAGALLKITPGAGGNPVATASPVVLTSGDDDFDGITITQIEQALARFVSTLGPGAVVLPGRTSLPAHQAVADHLLVAHVNRTAKLDVPDLINVQDLVDHGTAIRAHAAGDMLDMLAGRQRVPGLTTATTRTVALSCLRTAREAVNDAAGVSPNQPAAGRWGQATPDVALTREWTDAELEALYDAGINAAKTVDGVVRLYGSRTAVSPDVNPAGFRLGSARLRMALTELLRYRVEQVQFAELDPQGNRLKDLQAEIRADVDRFPTSIYAYRVVATVEDGEDPGSTVLAVGIEGLQVSSDAEVINAHISRTVTEARA